MDIQVKVGGDFTILVFNGRLDAVSASAAETVITKAIEDGVRHMIFSLAGLEYISSAGLRVVLMAAKKMSRQNEKVVLCELQESVREVFEISGLLSIFPIADTEAAAQSLAVECRS